MKIETKRRSRAPLFFAIAALVLVLAVGALVVRVRRARLAVSYESHPVAVSTIVRTVSGTGRVIATEREVLFAPSGGQIAELTAALGQSVNEGDLVLRTAQGGSVEAPFSGEVTAVYVKESEWVNPGVRLLEITNYGSLEISANVDELDVARIGEGMPATIYINALPDDARQGSITAIAREGALSGGIMTYAVRVSISDMSRLLIGMSAEVKVEVDRADDVLTVPVKAVYYTDDSPYVVVQVAERENRDQPVELGLSDGVNVEIKTGLNTGDVVLIRISTPTTITRPFSGMR
ncbi:MAG TPA: HlyD family efflux transporter periplasmic adaptor subunit [Bacillota bacterium]|nr:HlyD family efflux transporter periplasmic adaptor subunit [Bacillota bacterium]